jgi:nucleotide-binding universal stress UspA family protein
MIRKILVALDGSDHAAKAFDLAVELAKAHKAELVAMSVASDEPLTDGERHLAETEFRSEVGAALNAPGFPDEDLSANPTAEALLRTSRLVGSVVREAIAKHVVERAAVQARSAGVAAVRSLVKSGDPASGILAAVRAEKPDLLLVGNRGLGEMKELLLGSVSHKVAHLAPCSVVTVK